MRRSAIIAGIITVWAILGGLLASCKKNETAVPAGHEQVMEKSFVESKKAVAARVNGEEITMFAVYREMNAIAPQYLARGGQRTPALDEKIRKDALHNVIVQELAVQEARKRGLTVPPEAMDAEVRKIQANAGSEKAYQEYLARNGLSEAELRKQIEADALFELIATKEVDEKVMVTESALRARYQREKAGLKDAAHGQMTFEQARGMLEQKLREEAAGKRMQQWEKELQKNARIEIVAQKEKEGQ